VVKDNGATNIFGNNPNMVVEAPAQAQLINPETGVEFKQKELIRAINNPRDPFYGRRLISDPNTKKTIPALANRFTEIIRGENG
jgi:hypothetical protein